MIKCCNFFLPGLFLFQLVNYYITLNTFQPPPDNELELVAFSCRLLGRKSDSGRIVRVFLS